MVMEQIIEKMFVSVDVATENCPLILLCRQAYACPDNYCKECRRAMSNARYRRSLPASNPSVIRSSLKFRTVPFVCILF